MCKEIGGVENDEVVVSDLRDNGVDCTGENATTAWCLPDNSRMTMIATVTRTNIIRLGMS
jgi:hypothetical protein